MSNNYVKGAVEASKRVGRKINGGCVVGSGIGAIT